MIEKTASVRWEGQGKKGLGTISTETGALKQYPYGFASRCEDARRGTNPEEILAAAHAACFTMAFSFACETAGLATTDVDTTASVAPYTNLPHTWKAPELASASEARTKASPELAAVAEFSRILGARKDKTLEPLGRKAWQDAKKAAKAELEKVDPKRKDRKVVLEVEALAASPAGGPAPTDEKIRARLDRWKDELARDVWVDECTRILADMAKAK